MGAEASSEMLEGDPQHSALGFRGPRRRIQITNFGYSGFLKFPKLPERAKIPLLLNIPMLKTLYLYSPKLVAEKQQKNINRPTGTDIQYIK